MSRNSPSVDRAITILNFFSAHPKQAFSLNDVVKSLKISSATAHAILDSLSKSQFLYRFPDKTYMLGPAIARAGRSAMEALTPLVAARVSARALADSYDAICTVLAVRDGSAVVVERAASRSHLGWDLHREYPVRIALVGGVFAGWAPNEDLAAWLEKADPPLDDEQRKKLEIYVDFYRQHGFTVDCRPDGKLDSERARLNWNSQRGQRYPLATIDAKREYPVASFSAPTFDRDGRMILVLAMAGFTRPLAGAKIEEVGADLRDRCRHIARLVSDMGWTVGASPVS